ncbi:hypothetical protein HHI36_012499 [Cryptolaemus montrouzieri]|uniref:Uncharacterized protein n=1 Tax=Cryptolaemus montrouzieri TaxID=559131 RepID=A0ABD2NFJ9_9CUCU
MYCHMMRTPCQPSVAAKHEFSRNKVFQLLGASSAEVSVKQIKVRNLSSKSQRLEVAGNLRVVDEAHRPFLHTIQHLQRMFGRRSPYIGDNIPKHVESAPYIEATAEMT